MFHFSPASVFPPPLINYHPPHLLVLSHFILGCLTNSLSVSRWDRILIFAGCNLGAAACFIICFFLFPIVAVRPRKFAILYVHFLFFPFQLLLFLVLLRCRSPPAF